MPTDIRSLWIATLAAGLASPLGAQVVRGVVSDSARGEPVAEFTVQLLDARGATAAAALGGERGQFAVRAPAPGTYRLRVLRLGYRSTVTEPFAIGAGEAVERRVAVTAIPTGLATVRVTGKQKCVVRPTEGAAAATVWDEVRKAVQAVALTNDSLQFHMRVRDFDRTLAPDGKRVVSASSTEREGRSAIPYRSPSPDDLATLGYVQKRSDGVWYYAPDAAALLSDAFVGEHCLRVAPDDPTRPEIVALAFEPTRREAPPDIAGVIHVDRRTAELRDIEFTYTALSRFGDRFGGRVAFRRVPGGAWIIDEWVVRAPMVRVSQRHATSGYGGEARVDSLLTGVHESGGTVLSARTAAGVALWERAVVADSTPSHEATVLTVAAPITAAARCDMLRSARARSIDSAFAIPLSTWRPSGSDSAAIATAMSSAAAVFQVVADTAGQLDLARSRVLRLSRPSQLTAARAMLRDTRVPVDEPVPGCRLPRPLVIPVRLATESS